MAQLSRPYQIGLLVLGLLVAVWALALRPHGASTSGSSAPPAPPVSSVPAAQPGASASTGGSPSKIYHGAAPGLEGLSRAIAKAHGAVTTSQQNAKQLAERSAQASAGAPSAESPAASKPATTAPASPSATPATHASTPSTTVAPTPRPIKARSGADRTPARQALVERALREGKVAVILFWDPKGADDVVVHNQLQALEALHHQIKAVARVPQVRRELQRSGLELQKKFAAFSARANQVTSFGSITRGVQVFGTPTILVVGKSGKTTVLTGLTDAYAIEQAIVETRHA
jgi:hypothetical protein